MIDLAALEKLAQAATPGPWHYDDEGDFYAPCPDPEIEFDMRDESGADFVKVAEYDSALGHRQVTLNRVYIAAANPATVLAMISRMRELESGIKEYESGQCAP